MELQKIEIEQQTLSEEEKEEMINNIKTEIDNELNEEIQKDYEIINNNLNTITETTKKINEIKVLKLKNNISYLEKFKKKYHEYNIHRSKRENI